MSTLSTNTTLTYSPYVLQQENFECVMLKDLVYHKDLESMVQFNFLVDVEFLLLHVYDTNIPITIIHGQKNPPHFNSKRSNIKLYSPEIRDRYGTHHTKAMLLFFRDQDTGIKTVQMIVMTANLIQQDWEDMTQGIYRTPRCGLKSITKSSIQGTLIGSEYGSPFEHELIKYLKAYQLRSVFNIITQLRLYDWSSCKAILIGSVPGRHKASTFSNWGIERLANVLQQHVDLSDSCRSSSQLVLQCSSLANSPEKWFNILCQKMSESMDNSGTNTPKICVVYPTVETATESITGRYTSGDFLRFDKSTYEKNHTWFDSYLYDWRSRNAGRQRVMPHIKTYTRVFKDDDGQSSIAWHLLTSSNLSRAAWGDYQLNNTQLYIKSFELGVFFCPSLWEDDTSKEVVLRPTTNFEMNNETRAVIKVHLPYDLPLIRHSRPLQCFTRIE